MESNKPGTRHCHSWLANLILFVSNSDSWLPWCSSCWTSLSEGYSLLWAWLQSSHEMQLQLLLCSYLALLVCPLSEPVTHPPKSGMNSPFTFILLFLPFKNIHVLLLIKSWWPHYSLANTLLLKTLCFVLFLSDIYMSSRDLYWLVRLTS